MSRTGLMYSNKFAEYDAGDGYLICASRNCPWITKNGYYDTGERVVEAYEMLKKTGLLDKLVQIDPIKVEKEELVGFHTKEYIDKLDDVGKNGGGDVGELCQIGSNALDTIREALGGDLKALDLIMSGEIKNAFCMQRPPAGHAESDQGFGFCVVNNFNIIIDRARKKYGLKRIMIVDFDDHYKKGIEDAWYDTDEVLYAETHQTGALAENSGADRNPEFIGEGKGKGYNIVIPLPSGSGDEAYIKAFSEIILPVAEQYKPELVILVAGYAGNIFDPLGRQQLTATGYYKLTSIVKEIADKFANGRLLSVMEGGKGNYMAFCILKTIEAMSGEKTNVNDLVDGLIVRNHLTNEQEKNIENVKQILSPYWKL